MYVCAYIIFHEGKYIPLHPVSGRRLMRLRDNFLDVEKARAKFRKALKSSLCTILFNTLNFKYILLIFLVSYFLGTFLQLLTLYSQLFVGTAAGVIPAAGISTRGIPY